MITYEIKTLGLRHAILDTNKSNVFKIYASQLFVDAFQHFCDLYAIVKACKTLYINNKDDTVQKKYLSATYVQLKTFEIHNCI